MLRCRTSQTVLSWRAKMKSMVVMLALFGSGCSGGTSTTGVPVDLGVSQGEIIEYPVLCEVDLVNGDCPLGEGRPMYWTTFKVFVDKQMVAAETIGGLKSRYTKCAVVSRSSWECTDDDNTETLGFSDGQFWRRSHEEGIVTEESRRMIYVDALKWVAHEQAFVGALKEVPGRVVHMN